MRLILLFIFLFLPTAQAQTDSDVTSGLVGHWALDEGSGTTTADSSGSNNGILTGSSSLPQWISGVSGAALSFDGVSQNVTLSTPISTVGGFSASLWMYFSGCTAGPYPGCQAFESTSFSSQAGDFAVGANSSNKPFFCNWKNGSNLMGIGDASAISQNAWHLITTTWDGTTDKLYVDGLQVPTSGVPCASGWGAHTTIGGGYNGYRYNGKIDDVRYYNRALMDSEVQQLFVNKSSVPTYALSVVNQNSSLGSVTSVPSGITCPSSCSISALQTGSVVTLIANPNTGYYSSWSGCPSVNGNDCVVTLGTSDISVGVTFNQTQAGNSYSVSVLNVANGTVQGAGISCPGNCSLFSLPPGTNVVIQAVPNTGYLTDWQGCTSTFMGTQWSSSSNYCLVSIGQSNVSVSPNFVPISMVGQYYPPKPMLGPVITSLEAYAVSPTSENIVWTTSMPSDAQVGYDISAPMPPNPYGHQTPLTDTGAVENSVATSLTSHSVTLTGLNPNTVYHYSVSSHNWLGALTQSPDSNFTTAPAGQNSNLTPPSVPIAFVAVPTGATTMSLSWNPSTDYEGSPGVAGYNIYRCAGIGCIPSLIGTSTINSFNDTNLGHDTDYTYQVAAFDTAGNVSVPSFMFMSLTDGVAPTANNISEPGEACDGTDLNGLTCQTFAAGFTGGTLKCKADQSGYDVSQCTSGNTITSASCQAADVQAAINLANDGDTVLVPANKAGDPPCNWTDPALTGAGGAVLITNKAIVLKGAGIGNTVIYDNTSNSNVQPNFIGAALAVTLSSPKPVRITGFTFDGANSKQSDGPVLINGVLGSSFRVDHNAFVNISNRGVMTGGGVYGVVDHNSFTEKVTSGMTAVSISGDGDASWSRPVGFGTAAAVYVENNTFYFPTTPANDTSDTYVGGRKVFRYNTVYDGWIGMHGFDSDSHGEFCDVYNNTILSQTSNHIGDAIPGRSGICLMHDNTVSSSHYDLPITTYVNYRSSDYYPENYGGYTANGVCDGENPLDGNTPGLLGYPCKDQMGRGQGEALSPVYTWNNTLNGVQSSLGVGGYDDPSPLPSGTDRYPVQSVAGRDYFSNTPKPGYVEYPYPHPLVQLDNPTSTTTVLYGDVNQDGNVTIADAQLTAEAAIGDIILSTTQQQAAEVDGTGKVNIYDAYLIAQRAANLITTFPVQG